MISECLKIGDKVTVTISKESRDWGYNPCEDGTVATVKEFSEIPHGRIGCFGRKPGIYINREQLTLIMPDGTEQHQWTLRCELVDQEEYSKRVEEYRKNPDKNHREFLRELPKTKVWEGDKVKVNADHLADNPEYPDVWTIKNIDYSSINWKCNDGSPYPFYNISCSLTAGWWTSAKEDWIELVERGPVWKHYHGEPIEFVDIKEEANFYGMLGLTDEVRNPANNLFKWTKEEGLQAIKDGIAHSMGLGSALFKMGETTINMYRFRDEELGKRVAIATLEGFEK